MQNNFQMARAGTLMPTATGALQSGNDMINVNDA